MVVGLRAGARLLPPPSPASSLTVAAASTFTFTVVVGTDASILTPSTFFAFFAFAAVVTFFALP